MEKERSPEAISEDSETQRAPAPRRAGGDQFAGGPIPPVQVAAVEEDANVKELKTKVGALVAKTFGGDYKKAFEHYDGDKDGGVGKDEIKKLLEDAGVGNGLTRGAWASGIIEKVDKSADGKIQWTEFEAVFSGSALG